MLVKEAIEFLLLLQSLLRNDEINVMGKNYVAPLYFWDFLIIQRILIIIVVDFFCWMSPFTAMLGNSFQYTKLFITEALEYTFLNKTFSSYLKSLWKMSPPTPLVPVWVSVAYCVVSGVLLLVPRHVETHFLSVPLAFLPLTLCRYVALWGARLCRWRVGDGG